MIFRIPRLIEHISSIMALEVCTTCFTPALQDLTLFSLFVSSQEGDLILTGTPSGVGPLSIGDQVTCSLSDGSTDKELAKLEFGTVLRGGGYFYQPQ